MASSTEVVYRIGSASKVFGTLSWCVWKKHSITIHLKMKIFRSLVLPVLLYGSETWALLRSDIRKLESFQMRCLRRILGVSLRDRLKNGVIRQRCCRQTTVEMEIQQRRLRWFGHVCRMQPERYPHKTLWRIWPHDWKIQRGAPKKTWLKQISKGLSNCRLSIQQAKIVAMDRLQWRRTVKTLRTPVAPTAALNAS